MAHATSLLALSGLSPLANATDVADRKVGTLGADNYCANWFGSGVQALLCTPGRLGVALRRRELKMAGGLTFRRRRGSHIASAPGLAQATGQVLSPGQVLTVEGVATSSTVLFVHAHYGKHFVEARFSHLPRQDRYKILVSRDGARPLISLIGSDGMITKPGVVFRSTTG
jgi:hypothetical protein